MTRTIGCTGLLVLVVACSTERQEQSIWTLTALGEACPSAESAEPLLRDAWSPGSHEIDGMHCHVEEIVAIEELASEPTDACCSPVACEPELDAAQATRLYAVVCRPETCATSAQHYSPQEDVEQRLNETLPECALGGPEADAVTMPAVTCRYRVTAIYECSKAPG